MKVQGNRIEPGEIEAALVRFGVRDAIVGAEGARDQDRRLVAVVRPRPGTTVSPHELRAQAATELPRYLVPDLIRVVDDYPLTANGKVDRTALFGGTPGPDTGPAGAAVSNGASPSEPADEPTAAEADGPAGSGTVLMEPEAREQFKEQLQRRQAARGRAVGIGLPRGAGPDRQRRIH